MSSIKFIFTDFVPAAARHISESYVEVLKKGCDERSQHPISLSHFLPYSEFKKGVDLSTGDVYWKDSKRVTRLKCLGLAAATPIVHAVGLTLNLANRVAKVISLAHFWHPSASHLSFAEKCCSCGRDLLRIAFTPFIYLGLELSAVYGLIFPKSGKKLYATFERCAYGKELLAPCFQPYATKHLGGGIPGKKNEW